MVRNATNRPVEIHFADRVAVMLPGEKLKLDETELSGAAVRPLLRDGVLSCFEAPADPPPKVARPRKQPAKAARAAKPAGARTSEAPGNKRKAGKASPPRPDPAPHPGPKRGTEQARPASDKAEPTETSR